MKTKTLITVLLASAFLIAIAGALYYLSLELQQKQNNPEVAVADKLFGWKFPIIKFPLTGRVGGSLAYSDIRDPGGIPQGLPVRLKVPAIGVDSAIEDALITPDGRMDVPAGSKNVAWFSLGPHPGQVGSAVIGGHFGIENGVPFVFYNLDKIQVGDRVYITDDRGDTLAFVVRAIELFDRDSDATPVFTSQDGLAHLNLITCEGIWNRVNDTYPKRRVIFTDAIPAEAAASESAPDFGRALYPEATTTFTRSLDRGAEGADVVSLQTILEEKGFLTIPPGVAYGYFGPLTRAAVAKYQTANNISPPVGYFGPLTRANLISELAVAEVHPRVAVRPKLPSTAITNSNLLNLILSAKSLFTTPLDALITLLLLISIAFMALKIIRR
ncbi:MAG: sortase [Patescibacteria group bacterium]|nr:sortase [Patescibacteria group bacterium]